MFDWQGIRRLMLQQRRELLLAHLVAILATLMAVPVPLLMPLLVDEVLLQRPALLVETMSALFPDAWHGPVLFIGAVLMLTLLLRAGALLLGVWQTRQFTCIAKQVTFTLRRDMLQRMQQLSMREYETLGSGTVTSHFVTDLNTIDAFIGTSLSKSLVAALSLLGVSVVLFWLHWQLALFVLLLNPLVIHFTVKLGKRVKELKRRENSAFELFQQSLSETLEAMQQLRASNRDGYFIERVTGMARGIRDHSAAFSWKSDASTRLSFNIFLFGFDSFRAVGMLMVLFSDLSVGEMMAVFGYLWFMMTPVQDMLNVQYDYYSANASLGRINRLLSLQEEPRYPPNQNPFDVRESVGVTVKDICFRYRREGDWVLDHLNLRIEPGEKVALVGASGGGKSTLVQLLLGLYQSSLGQIRYGDSEIKAIGYQRVRDKVAVVLQHPALFSDTVRANLTMGREATDEQLWQALEVAQLRREVELLPQGLETVVGRGGMRLSGGQRQRLAIARMVLTDPKIVILDEATSALDAETEVLLHRALQQFLQGRTTLIIAHRLSAVKQADRAYVLADGRVIEEGSHDELLALNGLYARLYGELQ